MAEKYIIAADRTHVRIYRYSQEPGQFTPSLQPVDALDLVDENEFSRNQIDLPGRFSNSPFGTDIVPRKEEVHSSADKTLLTDRLADRIAVFMSRRPNATWDLAANAALANELFELLPEPIRARLNRVVSKDLINVPPAELREHFALR